MSKIVKFVQEKYKIFLPIMVLLVLGITVYFLYKEYKYDNYRDKREYEVYQYFGGEKLEYQAIITYDLQKNIRDITPKNKKIEIEYDSTPVYYKNSQEVLFPSEMLVAFPLRGGSQYRVYKYSKYIKKDNIDKIMNANETGTYDNFFMYDGKNLFFFPTKVSLRIDNVPYIDLSGGSYLSLVGNTTLIYYDYAKDKSDVIEVEGKNISVTSEYINININERYFKSFNDIVLLSRPDNLQPLYKSN